MLRPHRRSIAAIGLLTALAVPPAAAARSESAVASVLTTRGQTSCSGLAISQPFLSLSDGAAYFLAPGGSFEGTHGWTLGKGAGIVSDNEPAHLAGPTDAHALEIGSGASATSASGCADGTMPSMRLYVRRISGSGRLSASVIVPGVREPVVLAESIGATSAWAPTAPIVFPQSTVGVLRAGMTLNVSLRFSADPGSVFRIDDVYIDPFKRV